MSEQNLTQSRNYPQPSPEHTLLQDVERIRDGFSMVDRDVELLLQNQINMQQQQQSRQLNNDDRFRRVKLNNLLGEALLPV